jgi:predicted ATP-grasp superfamily ATP-dependent carboligase
VNPLFDLHVRPDLESPAFIVALDGWIDAGYGAAAALRTVREHNEFVTVATFDTDNLLDHRSRRPSMDLVDGVITDLSWPAIELCAGVDRNGKDVLLLVGAEPDHTWRAFSNAAVDLALEFGARLVTGLGAYPAPVPHTRSTRIVSTAPSRELAEVVGYIPGRVEVPAGVAAAIQMRAAEVGLPAFGLWAQVPHYASAMPYPAAAAALIEGLDRAASVSFGTGDLVDEAAKTRTRLDELVSGSPEHLDLVRQLEEQVDTIDAGQISEMSGDELAAEFEKFLRDQDS